MPSTNLWEYLMARNQNATVDPVVRMDSRKFLGALNDSAQAKIAFFEDRIEQMGRQAGRDYRLTALHAKQLYFEDVDNGQYFVAEHSRDKGKVSIANIRPVEIVEEEKQGLFKDSCQRLVTAIEENDQKGMQAAYNRMKAQRFSGRVVPFSGYIKSRDGITRHINVVTTESLNEDARSALIRVIVEGLRDNVIVEDGRVVSGTFNDGEEIRLPVTKWAARKLVAKKMRDAAQGAYWSEGFQHRVLHTAKLISDGKIEDAVRSITPFLDENEEFTLLKRGQVQILVENALAANAIFNTDLCRDTATLFHRTNMQISRSKIIGEWRNIARKTEHPVLAENVQILEEATNFDAAYDKFLELIFEAISNKEVAAEALATTLLSLKNKTPKIKESHDLSSKLDNLIVRLKQRDFDDAAIYEAEDLIATIQEELAATDTLQNFDQMPGENLGNDLPLGGAGGEGQPVININSPLIQVGGQSSAGGAGEEEEAAPPPPPQAEEPTGGEAGGGAEDELAAILGGGGGGAAGAAGGGGGLGGFGESTKRGKALAESRPVHYEMKDEGDDDNPLGDTDDPMDESIDPYAVRKDELNIAEASATLMDYGAPVITDSKDLKKVVAIMGRLAEEHELQGRSLEENLVGMAQAGIKAIGLRIPPGRLTKAIDECVMLFRESDKPFPGAAAPFGKKRKKDEDNDSGQPWKDDDEGVAEDQFKGPRIRGRGYNKTSYGPREMKAESVTRNEAIVEGIHWGESQSDGILGELAGVQFIFDHGGDNEVQPVILSNDGAVEIPIPESIQNSAYASAGLIDGDAADFIGWLFDSIEQLRPISEEEDRALEEAMATITTTPDGGISVQVSDEVDVDHMDHEANGMEPVDSLETGDEFGAEHEEEGMPDYEAEEGMGGDEFGGEEMGEPGESGEMGGEEMGELGGGGMGHEEHEAGEFGEEGIPGDYGAEEEDEMLEDKDVTEPRSSKYTKHVKEDPRTMPDHKPTKKTDDNLEEIGPDLKKDDGTGTKPPTARTMSNK